MKEIGLNIALPALVRELNSDPDYRESWRANIAMAFQDQWRWTLEENSDCLPRETVQEIANKAADHFLNLLTSE